MEFKKEDRNVRNVVYQKFRSIHKGMIARCYRKGTNHYEYYGGRGVYVCDKWRELDGFLEDVDKIEGFDLMEILYGRLFLDKDIKIKGNTVYSLETCKWVNASENTFKYPNQQEMILVSPYPEFKLSYWNNKMKLAEHIGCSTWSLGDLLKGKTKKINGYQLFYLNKFDESKIIKDKPRKFLGISPDGVEYVFYYQLRFAKEHGLTAHTISECISGKHKQHKGWRFREITDEL